jgi:hypothetical protein
MLMRWVGVVRTACCASREVFLVGGVKAAPRVSRDQRAFGPRSPFALRLDRARRPPLRSSEACEQCLVALRETEPAIR